MAIDFEAIRKKLAYLNGQKIKSAIQFWKPEPGDYKLRVIPWSEDLTSPIKELWFYYIGQEKAFLAPKQFQQPDPIDDLVKKLRSSSEPNDKLIVKKLYPKMRSYLPIIIRGQEDKGPQVWSFGKEVYARILSFFLDEDLIQNQTGFNVFDVNNGLDFKVSIIKKPGNTFFNTEVDVARRASKLSSDQNQLKKWLDEVANIDLTKIFKPKSPQEIEAILNKWLSSDDTKDSNNDASTTQTRGGNQAAENTASSVDTEKVTTPPTIVVENAKSTPLSEEDINNKKLDDAFAELMGSDD